MKSDKGDVASFFQPETILGVLAGKTRILATNHLHVLPKSDYVVCISNGEIVQQGKYHELLKDESGYLATMVRDYGAAEHKEDGDGDEKGGAKNSEGGKATKKRFNTAGRQKQLMTSEERDTGAVKLTIYKKYVEKVAEHLRRGTNANVFLRSGTSKRPVCTFSLLLVSLELLQSLNRTNLTETFPTFGFLVVMLTLTQCSRIGADLWLGYWSSETYPFSTSLYEGVYVAWGVAQGICVLFTGEKRSRVYSRHA